MRPTKPGFYWVRTDYLCAEGPHIVHWDANSRSGYNVTFHGDEIGLSLKEEEDVEWIDKIEWLHPEPLTPPPAMCQECGNREAINLCGYCL